MDLYDPNTLEAPDWGITGELVYNRTYSRPKPDGTHETWAETVERVVKGNMGYVYGDPSTWSEDNWAEAKDLFDFIYNFKLMPAGRHLWATGVEGANFVANCHVSGWGDKPSSHYEYTFMRLMEGGGVGANYSTNLTAKYGAPTKRVRLTVYCSDHNHADYAKMADILDDAPEDVYADHVIDDSREGWAQALSAVIDAAYQDAPTDTIALCFDVAKVRPFGAELKTFGGTASGPRPLVELLKTTVSIVNTAYDERRPLSPMDAMEIDHAVAAATISGGSRRSARLALLHWNDPYIFEFLACKADHTKHWSTNISIEIDNDFVERARVEGTHAYEVHQLATQAMYSNGEPGYWNYSLANSDELREVRGSNPCGEILLDEWESCIIGNVNLAKFASEMELLPYAHELMTRFLMRATFAPKRDPKQVAVVEQNRRIGVGHYGVQGFLNKNGIRLSEAKDVPEVWDMLDSLYSVVRETSRGYAFDLRIPEPVKVTCVPPTGSVAKLSGDTEGIHPIYSRYFLRRVRFANGRPSEVAQVRELMHKGYEAVPDIYADNTTVVSIPTMDSLVGEVTALGVDESVVEAANEISMADMLAFQAKYQEHWADNAISFTVNFTPGTIDHDTMADTMLNYLPRLMGTTVMPDTDARPLSPYARLTKSEYLTAMENVVGDVEQGDAVDLDCSSGACPIR